MLFNEISNNKTKAIVVITVIEKPNTEEANMSPIIIPVTLIGIVKSLSKVLSHVSHGVITGLIEVEVNHKVMPINPLDRNIGVISLPSEKAKKKKAGIINPKIKTGPLL